MPSFQTQFLINFIKRMSPQQRKTQLQDLLAAFPNDWLAEALSIGQEITESRKAPGAPLLRPKPITPSAEYKRYP